MPIAALRSSSPVWVDITPDRTITGSRDTCIGSGIAIDPNNPSVIYWANAPFQYAHGGLFKTTDSGNTWRRVASITPVFPGAADYIDQPLHVRVDPADSNHLYVGAFRSISQGFWVSHDAGETFVQPPGFTEALDSAELNNADIYDVAVDPADFDHILMTWHFWWGVAGSRWGMGSGVFESIDGGDSWIVHAPVPSWGTGHSIDFLHSTEHDLGDGRTWLLGTQSNGMWRTTDAGTSWTKVSDTNITHGAGDIYYSRTGVLYTSGTSTMRSFDNGATWEAVGPRNTWTVHGDGELLFTGSWFLNQPFQVSSEDGGSTWVDYNDQRFDGPYEMDYDPVNQIMYSSNWSSGVWALRMR